MPAIMDLILLMDIGINIAAAVVALKAARVSNQQVQGVSLLPFTTA